MLGLPSWKLTINRLGADLDVESDSTSHVLAGIGYRSRGGEGGNKNLRRWIIILKVLQAHSTTRRYLVADLLSCRTGERGHRVTASRRHGYRAQVLARALAAPRGITVDVLGQLVDINDTAAVHGVG